MQKVDRLILQGSEIQVEFLRQMGASVVDGKLTQFKLVGFGSLDQYEAEGMCHVLSVARNAQRTTAEIVIEVMGIDPHASLATTWNTLEGKPVLRFTALSHPGVAQDQWNFAGQVSGPEFIFMAA